MGRKRIDISQKCSKEKKHDLFKKKNNVCQPILVAGDMSPECLCDRPLLRFGVEQGTTEKNGDGKTVTGRSNTSSLQKSKFDYFSCSI